MSEALVQPVWLPPRTTSGAPNTMKSEAAAASRAVASLTGNSAMATPCARKACRIAGLSSSCESIRTSAARAAWASRAIDAGTSWLAGEHALHQAIERLIGKPRALDHAAALLRLGEAGDRRSPYGR